MTVGAVDGIVARGLRLGYGDSTIITGLDLQARVGQITAIVGPNGSGKSTLMKGLSGLLPPQGGTLELFGEDVSGWETSRLIRRDLGYVPQVSNVFPSLTVRENLDIGATICRAQLRERLPQVFELFPDLEVAQRKAAGLLSGGQRNMLALARALMTSPRLLLVDEPTAGLSPKYAGAVWDHLVRLREAGIGVLVVEQNVHAALLNSDLVYLLVNGSIAFEGAGAELMDNEQLTDSYLGGSETVSSIQSQRKSL
jgi:branched-chain amino acid transport system ATP-binding protein